MAGTVTLRDNLQTRLDEIVREDGRECLKLSGRRVSDISPISIWISRARLVRAGGAKGCCYIARRRVRMNLI